MHRIYAANTGQNKEIKDGIMQQIANETDVLSTERKCWAKKKKNVKRKKKRKPHLWKSKHFAVFDTISQPVEKKTLCE